MKVETPWWAKILIGVFVTASTIVGSLITGWEYIKETNKTEVVEAEKRIMTTMTQWKVERKAEIKSGDEILGAKVTGLADKVDSIDKNVRIILSRQLKQISGFEKTDGRSYTGTYTKGKGDNI